MRVVEVEEVEVYLAICSEYAYERHGRIRCGNDREVHCLWSGEMVGAVVESECHFSGGGVDEGYL